MNMKHRVLSFLLVLALILSFVPMAVFADEIPLSWTVENGVLTVSGTTVPDYTLYTPDVPESAETAAPWAVKNDETGYDPALITKIVISDGTVSIGENAFAGLESVTDIELPAALTSLGANALPAAMQGAKAVFGTEEITFGADPLLLAPTAPTSDREGYTASWAGFTLNKETPVNVGMTYAPITYYATFMNGEDEVGKVEFTVESTELAEPDVPARTGYTGAWESYTLGAGDITVNAVYTLATYTVTFMADGKTVGTDTYTIEDASVTAPQIPAKTGYTAAWEAYTLGASDLTVKAVYTPVTYYATFVADGKTVSKVPFTVETAKLTEPAVPAKTGFNGAWKAYTLGAKNITVEAVYTFATYQGKVTASYLNVRSAATTGSSISGGLSRGSTVTIVAEQTDASGMKWGKLSSGGWVSLTYVQKIASTSGGTSSGGSSSGGTSTATKYTATVTASSLNVRSGAGTGYGVQGSLSRGTSVTYTEEKTASNGTVWCRLTSGGWVSKAYLGNIKAVATTTGGSSSGGSSSSGTSSGGTSSGNTSTGFKSYTATVSVSSVLNVRSGAGTGHGVVSTLTNGTKVTVTAEAVSGSTTWAKIATGWVSKAYLKSIQYIGTSTGSTGSTGSGAAGSGSSGTATTGTKVMITASSLNVRSGPGTGYSRVGSYYNGQTVTVTQISGNWGKTSSGWICMDYTMEVTPPVQVDGDFAYTFSTYTTDCSTSSAARKTNLRIACETMNGTILAPGGSFSYNGTLGQRTPAKGYQLAPYIGAGSVTYGGGICQVSSTLFNAVLLGNLQLLERVQHYGYISYVPLGRDAAVSWGSQDFRFRNNSNYYIQIYAYTDGNTVTVSLLTREDVSPASDVTLQVLRSGTRYTLNRYYQGNLNYTAVSYY